MIFETFLYLLKGCLTLPVFFYQIISLVIRRWIFVRHLKHSNTSDQVKWNVGAAQNFDQVEGRVIISILYEMKDVLENLNLVAFKHQPIIVGKERCLNLRDVVFQDVQELRLVILNLMQKFVDVLVIYVNQSFANVVVFGINSAL